MISNSQLSLLLKIEEVVKLPFKLNNNPQQQQKTIKIVGLMMLKNYLINTLETTVTMGTKRRCSNVSTGDRRLLILKLKWHKQ
jgi:hypothetical protein